MIRIRCETGVRPRNAVWSDVLAPPDWIRLALLCAYLQAHSVLDTGKKKIPELSIRAMEPSLDLSHLYEAGLVELIAWDEHDRTRKLSRIRSADLSLRAADSLITAGLLPRYFLPILLSEDLLGDPPAIVCRKDELTFAEFRAWIECGGLGNNREAADKLPREIDPPKIEERRERFGRVEYGPIGADGKNGYISSERYRRRPNQYAIDRDLAAG